MEELMKLYEEIVSAMDMAIPEKWKKIVFYSELIYEEESNSTSICFYYLDTKGVYHQGLGIAKEYPNSKEVLSSAVKDIHSYSRSVGEVLKKYSPLDERYIRFILIIDEDFHLTSKVDYEVDSGDEHERRLKWIDEYLS